MLLLAVNGTYEVTIQQAVSMIQQCREERNLVTLTMVHHEAIAAEHMKTNSVGRLHVCVVGAENMPHMDLIGCADPYCVVEFGRGCKKRIRQTEVRARDVDPIWNEHIEFAVNDIEELHQELRFHVYDYDKYSEDDRIGSAGLSPENVWGLQKVMGDAKYEERLAEMKVVKAANNKPDKKRRARRKSLSGDPQHERTEDPAFMMQFGIQRGGAVAPHAEPDHIEDNRMWSPPPSKDWVMCFNDQQHPYYQDVEQSAEFDELVTSHALYTRVLCI